MASWTPKNAGGAEKYGANDRVAYGSRQFKGLGRHKKRQEAGLCTHCEDVPEVHTKCRACWFKDTAYNHLGTRMAGSALEELWKRQDGRCAYTGVVLIPGENASLDHKTPRTKKGSMEVDNLQWVSSLINRMKTDMTEEEFLRTCAVVLEFRRVY